MTSDSTEIGLASSTKAISTNTHEKLVRIPPSIEVNRDGLMNFIQVLTGGFVMKVPGWWVAITHLFYRGLG